MKYISFLRGINVSGKKIIIMDDLRSLYETLGFTNIESYIQSGNLIFDTGDNEDKDKLQKQIESAIEEKYGFQVPVQIITVPEINEIIDNCPFKKIDAEKEGSSVLVSFLNGNAEEDKISSLDKYRSESEAFVVEGSHIYLFCPEGYGKTKLNNNRIEKSFSLRSTTRNWNTILKMYKLSGGLD